MARPIAVRAVAAMLGLAACSGNGSAEPPSTSRSASSTSSSTTITGTTTTTTVPATTTTSALDAEKAKVEAAYRTAQLAYDDVAFRLDTFDPTSLASFIVAGPFMDRTISQFQALVAAGRRARPNSPDLRDRRIESVSLSAQTSTTASVTVCDANNIVIFEPGPSSGTEDDVIIDDAVVAHRFIYDMAKDGGMWKMADLTSVHSWPGSSQCPPP